MKQISKKAKDMILRYGVSRVDAYGENDDFLDELEDNEFESLCSYIATLEAEVEALRLHKNQEAQISGMVPLASKTSRKTGTRSLPSGKR